MIWSDNVHRPELERIHRKTEKREAVREKKAESAAKLEKSIENELLERLKKGTYGDIYNFAPEEFNNMLDLLLLKCNKSELSDVEKNFVDSYVEKFPNERIKELYLFEKQIKKKNIVLISKKVTKDVLRKVGYYG